MDGDAFETDSWAVAGIGWGIANGSWNTEKSTVLDANADAGMAFPVYSGTRPALETVHVHQSEIYWPFRLVSIIWPQICEGMIPEMRLIPQRIFNFIQLVLLVLIACSIPFHRNISTVLVIVYAVASLASNRFEGVNLKRIIPFALFYGFTLMGLLYSDNRQTALFELVKQIHILALPLVFALGGQVSARLIRTVLIAFTGLIGVLFVYGLVSAWSVFQQTGEYKVLFYHDLASQVSLSALYFSMFLVFSILVIIQELFQPTVNKSKSIFLYCLLFLYVLFVVMLASRASVLALLAVFLFSLVEFKKKPQARIFRIVFFLSILGVILCTLFVPLLNERFREAINYQNQFTIEKVGGGTSFRIAKWESSVKVLKQNFLFGTGTGDVQEALDKQYQIDGHLQILHLNAHNQYLQCLLGQGLPGLFAFLACLVAIVKTSRRTFYSMGFVVIFGFCSFTESMLEVQKGILFFSFFSGLFLFSEDQANEKPTKS